MVSKRRRYGRKQAKSLGALAPLLIIDSLPDDLLAAVCRAWPEGRISRCKVETYIRHRLTNYDAIRFNLHRQRYDELRSIAQAKVAAALDTWLTAHPNITDL